MVRERRYFVYIMASKSRVLNAGVTGFLMARVLRHKSGEGRGRPRLRNGGGDEGVRESRFLTGLSARFGMTR